MASTGESADQVQLQTTMGDIERFVQWVETGQIDDKDLHRYRILVLLLDPHGQVPSRPRFFAPYAPELPDPRADYVGRELVTGHLVHAAEWPQPVINYLTRYLELICRDLPKGQSQWSLDESSTLEIGRKFNLYLGGYLWISVPTNLGQPHIKFIHWNKQEINDDALACNELMNISQLMRSRVARYKGSWEAIYPTAPDHATAQKPMVNILPAQVLVISLNGSRARVLEAYFDGKMLVVRRTRSYDFADGDMGVFKTLARWFLADAVGDIVHGALGRLKRI